MSNYHEQGIVTYYGGQTTYETQSLPLEFSRENKLCMFVCVQLHPTLCDPHGM